MLGMERIRPIVSVQSSNVTLVTLCKELSYEQHEE